MIEKKIIFSLSATAYFLIHGYAYAHTTADAPCLVSMFIMGNVDKALAARVESWVQQSVGPVEKHASPKSKTPSSLEEVYATIKESNGKNSMVTLVLAGGISPHGDTHGLVSNRVAVIDVDMLKPADTSKEGWQEVFARRVEKESLAGVAYAFEMKACVFERCALKPAETTDELDAKGRNLCPPCEVKLQALLEGQKK